MITRENMAWFGFIACGMVVLIIGSLVFAAVRGHKQDKHEKR